MAEGDCIRIWMRDNVPDRYKEFETYCDDSEALNTVFVAHVPAAFLEDGYIKWRQKHSRDPFWPTGLFGTNSIDTFPDPGDDGIVIVGGCI